MKIQHIMRICSIFAIFLIVGCTTNAVEQAPAPGNHNARLPAFYAPENQYYYFTAAQIQRKKGNLDQAIIMLRKAIELDAESPYLQRELATVYLQNKEGDKAIKVLEELLQRYPDDVKALIIYGGTKQVRKENKDAIAAYEKILVLDPKQERVYSLLGNLYVDAGDYKRAEATFRRLLKNFPTSYAGHYFLGRVNAKQGKLKEAEREYKKALELVPDRPEPRFELIKLYKDQGKTILFVSHDLTSVEKFCDRAVWLEKGQILAEGVKRASGQIEGSSEFAMHVKGLELPGYDPRGMKGT